MSAIDIRQVNYGDKEQASHLLTLLDAYAGDPMGGGEKLPDATRANLIGALRNTPNAVSFIAYRKGEPVGLLNAFQALSTFAAKPLFNIHDLAVMPEARGQGVAQALMAALEEFARARDACKITLEVLGGNAPAKALYIREGYTNYQLDPAMGQAEFMQKFL